MEKIKNKPSMIVIVCALIIAITLEADLSTTYTVMIIILPAYGFGWFLSELDNHYKRK